MILRWEVGRATVDDLLAKQYLQTIPANIELANAYLDQARAHLEVSELSTDRDPIGSFQLAYDSARKAISALVVVQGLRPTSSGGHIAVYDTVMAQFGSVLGDVIRPFPAMRRLRNSSEYPSLDHPTAGADDARRAQGHARAMLDACSRLVGEIPVY